jgi:hypothetical protein
MSSRPLAALASVALIGLALLVLLPDCASACSCAVFGSKKQVEWALSHPGAVFTGEVVKIDRPSPIKSSLAPEKRSPSGSPSLGRDQKELR